MNTICQMCGGIGTAKDVPLLTYCRKCQTYAVHRYCLEKLPGRDEEVYWLCEQCESNPHTIIPVKKCRLRFRRDKDKVESQNLEPNCSDSITRTKDRYKQISSPAETVSTQKLERSFTRGSVGVVGDSVQNKGEDYGHTLLELSKGKKLGRRRLVLVDDDDSDSIMRPKDCYKQIPISAESILTQKMKSGPTTSSVLMNMGETYEHSSSKQSEKKKLKRRRLVVSDDDESDIITKPKDCYEHIPGPAETVLTQELESGPTTSSVHIVNKGEAYGCSSLEQSEDKKLKRRRLVLTDDDGSAQEFQSNCVDQNVNKATRLPTESSATLPSFKAVPSSSNKNYPDEDMNRRLQIVAAKTSGCLQVETNDGQANMNESRYQGARPIIDRVWRGCFSISDEEYGPFSAHLSNKACEKVCNVSKLLPRMLCMEKLPRLNAWPNSFKTAPPTYENIGLYFFPECARVAAVFGQLLNEVINKDLVLKFVLDGVELLVFSATILPEDHQKFQGKHYLWGVFRGSQNPPDPLKSSCPSKSNELAKENQATYADEDGEVDGCEVLSEVIGSSLCTHRALNGLQSNDLTEEMQKTEDSCKHLGEKEREEKQRAEQVSVCSREIEGGDICDDYFNIFERTDSVAEEMQRTEDTCKHLGEKEREEKRRTEKVTEFSRQIKGGENCDKYLNILKKTDSDILEGEICDDLDISQKGVEEAQCLELFPLQAEDLGIVCRVETTDELNLDLGLSSADGKGHCGLRFSTRSKTLFDSSI